MPDLEDSFLQQIASHPHDWLPRLIFADWLEEQGDPRGELIRLSHQLTRLDCEQRQQKEGRLQALSAAGVVWPSPTLANSLNMAFVLIPPGQFRMGSPESEPYRHADETQVDVNLTHGFWLGQSSVTQAVYQAVMGKNPSYHNRENLKADSSLHPVEEVSWEDAMEFCQKLTTRERAEGRLPFDWEYTLPTEAQWEYTCRAGMTTATAFGDKLDSTQANFNGYAPYYGADQGKHQKKTMPVGSYQPNAWNLYDMHGNVWEWCRDWYVNQLPGGTDPGVVKTATFRVYRGGSWHHDGRYSRSAFRSRSTPDLRSLSLGFRVAAVQAR